MSLVMRKPVLRHNNAKNKDADQPVYPRRLIYFICLLIHCLERVKQLAYELFYHVALCK